MANMPAVLTVWRNMHFALLMLEDRSYVQMLGYLEVNRHDVDGLKRENDEPWLIKSRSFCNFLQDR